MVRILKGFPKKDVYYLPEYSRLCMENGEGFPLAAYYEDENGKIFYPFLQRTVHQLSWLINKSDWQKYKDIITPYGYGGPLIVCQKESRRQLISLFRNEFDKYCRENGIISEFIRFHPILENHLDYPEDIDVKFNRHTVVINLQEGPENIWKNMNKSCRYMIRKAKKIWLMYVFPIVIKT